MMKKKRGRPPGKAAKPRERPEWEVSTKQAAKELNTTQETVRWKMSHNLLPIGEVTRREGSSSARYVIFRKWLDAYKEQRGIP